MNPRMPLDSKLLNFIGGLHCRVLGSAIVCFGLWPANSQVIFPGCDECVIPVIPNIRYLNPTGEVQALRIPITLVNGNPKGPLDTNTFDTNQMKWPLERRWETFGVVKPMKTLASRSFSHLRGSSTFGEILRACNMFWSDHAQLVAFWGEFQRLNADSYAAVTNCLEAFLEDELFRRKREKWVSLCKNAVEVRDDGFWSSSNTLTNVSKKPVFIYQFATVLFLGQPRTTNLNYVDAISLWLAIERDATVLPTWQRLEHTNTFQSHIVQGSCFRSADSKAAFAQINYRSKAFGSYGNITIHLFERLDSDGHRVSDYYENNGKFFGRDTLLPLCDGGRHFIALLAVTQLVVVDNNIPGPQLVRETLGSTRESAEELYSNLCQRGQSVSGLMRREPD